MAPRRNFGETWWGRAWVRALEQRAQLDPNRLPRGRTYARKGAVHHITVDVGEVSAFVSGSRAQPYRVRIALRTFDDDEWKRVVDAIVARAGHAAALVDGVLEPGVDDAAREADVELMPTAGELSPSCSCPDWADPCKHSAATVYLVADELDRDPFQLFLLRGRSKEELLAEVRARRSAASGRSGEPITPTARRIDPGVRAVDAWAREAAALPRPIAMRSTPGEPAPLPTDPPAAAPFDSQSLNRLAADAAERSWRALIDGETLGLDLDPAEDLARRGAVADPETLATLAACADVRPAALAQRGEGWKHGGEAGLRMVEEERWQPPPLQMAEAKEQVRSAWPTASPRVVLSKNTITIDKSVQLRLGRDHRWYRFEKRKGSWLLAAPPATAPDDLTQPSP